MLSQLHGHQPDDRSTPLFRFTSTRYNLHRETFFVTWQSTVKPSIPILINSNQTAAQFPGALFRSRKTLLSAWPTTAPIELLFKFLVLAPLEGFCVTKCRQCRNEENLVTFYGFLSTEIIIMGEMRVSRCWIFGAGYSNTVSGRESICYKISSSCCN